MLAREGLEDVRQKLRRHAAAGVGEDELVVARPLDARGVLDNPQRHRAARRRELHRIAEHVHEHLLQAKPVALYQRMGEPFEFNREGDARFFAALREHRLHLESQRSQIHLSHGKHQAPVLDHGEIENLVDQREQMVARQRDLRQAVVHFLRMPLVHARELRHADDGVHRRADIVAHAREEVALGVVGGNRRAIGVLHGQLELLLALLERRDVLGCVEKPRRHPRRVALHADEVDVLPFDVSPAIHLVLEADLVGAGRHEIDDRVLVVELGHLRLGLVAHDQALQALYHGGVGAFQLVGVTRRDRAAHVAEPIGIQIHEHQPLGQLGHPALHVLPIAHRAGERAVAAVVVEDNAGNDEDEYHHDDEQGVPTAFIGLVDHLLGSGGRERLQHHPAETRHLAKAHRARAALSLVAVRDRLVIGKSALQIAGARGGRGVGLRLLDKVPANIGGIRGGHHLPGGQAQHHLGRVAEEIA